MIAHPLRILLVLQFATIAVFFSGCGSVANPEKPQHTIWEQRLQLPVADNYHVLPLEAKTGEELRFELSHLAGEPVSFVLVEKQDWLEFLKSKNLVIYPSVYAKDLQDRFDSTWLALPAPAIYNLVLWSAKASSNSSGPSQVNIRVTAR